MDEVRVVRDVVYDLLVRGRRIARCRDRRAEQKVESRKIGGARLQRCQQAAARRIQAQQESRFVIIRVARDIEDLRAVRGHRRTCRRESRDVDRIEAAAQERIGLQSAIETRAFGQNVQERGLHEVGVPCHGEESIAIGGRR